jgi:WD40 repeat protein
MAAHSDAAAAAAAAAAAPHQLAARMNVDDRFDTHGGGHDSGDGRLGTRRRPATVDAARAHGGGHDDYGDAHRFAIPVPDTGPVRTEIDVVGDVRPAATLAASAARDAMPAHPHGVPLESLSQPMAKPTSIAHYVANPDRGALASQRFVAPPELAGIELEATFGFGHRGRRNVHWHPTTGVFVYSQGPCVVVDDLATRVQRHLLQHVEEVSAIAIQHDGRLAASACGPSEVTEGMGQICIWELSSGCCTQSLLYHVGDIGCMAFSENDQMLVSVGNYSDCAIAVWEVGSGELLAASQSDWPVNAVAWDPSSLSEFVTVGEAGQLNFWMVAGDEERPVLHVHAAAVPEELAGTALTALCFDGHGRLYVGDSDGTVSMWSTEDNTCLESWPAELGEVCVISVGDGRMATAGASRSVKLWSFRTDEHDGVLLESELEVALDGEVTALSLDAALAMGVAATTAGSIWYLNTAAGAKQKIRLVSSHTEQITGLVFSGDEKYLASTSVDGTLRLWSVGGGEQIMQFELASRARVPIPCTCVSFSPDSSKCVAGYGDGTIRSFNLDKVELESRYTPHDCAVLKIEYSLDGKVVLSGNEKGTIIVSSAGAGSTLRVLTDHKGAAITAMDLCRTPSADADGLAVWLAASHDRRISVWRADWGGDSCDLVDWITVAGPDFVPGHDAPLEPPTLARFSPSNPDVVVVACFGVAPQILFHSISAGRIVRKIRLTAWPRALDIAFGTNLIAAGFDNRLLRIIDYDQGTCQDFVGHSAPCALARFSAEGTYLASAGCDGICVWKVEL